MTARYFSLILAISMLAGAGCSVEPGAPETESRSQALTVDVGVDIQTAHPYANHEDQSWEIAAPPEAHRLIIYFDYFDLERNYDYVDIFDAEGERIHHLTGQHDGESFAVAGSSARIRFRSDYSITYYGFSISHYSYEVEDPTRPTDHRPFCDAIGSRSEGWYWGDTGELIRFERCFDMPRPECGAIGSRSEGWYIPDQGLLVWDNCHRTVRIALAGETCGPSIGFSCYDDLYCQGLPTGTLGGSGTCRQHGYCETPADCDAEGNEWIHVACVGYATCEEGSCGWMCDSAPVGPWSWTTYLLRNIESAHPYANNTDQTWQVHHEGATRMRIFFSHIGTERGYDRLVLSGNREERAMMIEGYHQDYWTEELGGDTVTINLQTDYSVVDYGFQAESVSVYEQLPLGTCNRNEDCQHGETCRPSLCVHAYAPCYGTCEAASGSTYATFVASDTPMEIPDNDDAGVTSRIVVDGMAAVGCSVTANVTVRHSWRGDLRVALVRPDGTEAVLHDRSGGSADDLILVDEEAGPVDAADGEWILRVSDLARADRGRLESWSLTVDCS